jgi:tetratricopeptide (TPR) repeat protein
MHGVLRVKCIFCGSASPDAVCISCGEALYDSSPTVFLPALSAKQGISDGSRESGSLVVVLTSSNSMRTETLPQHILDRSSDEADGSLLKSMGISEVCSPGTYLILSKKERETLSRILSFKPTREKHDETLMRIGTLHYLLARGLDGLGQWAVSKREDHLAIAKKAFSRVKSNAVAKRNLGLVHMESGDEKKAMKNIDAALKELRKDPEPWAAKGMLLHRDEKLEESLKCFDRAVKLDEYNPRILTARGDLLVDMSRLEQAMECFDEAIVLDRTFLPAWKSKADVLARMGRKAEATDATDVIRDMVSTGETIEDIIEELELVERIEEAPVQDDLLLDEDADREDILQMLLQVDGIGRSKAETLIDHGIDSMNGLRKASLEDLVRVKGISEKIAQSIKETIESRSPQESSGPEDQSAETVESARTHLEDGDYEKALADYDSLVETDPENADAWFNRGELLQALGSTREALEAFDEVLKIDQRNVGGWMEKANILLEMGKPFEAVECYRRIVEANPDNTSYLVARASILADEGHHEAAILCYEIVLDQSPENIDASLGIVSSLFKLGDFDRAEDILEHVSRLTSVNEKVWWARGYLMDKRGRWGAAVQFYDRAISVKWNYIDPWIGKGEILQRQGKYGEAMSCYEKVLEVDSKHIPAWLGKAAVLDGTGEREQAMRLLDKLLETHPGHEEALSMKSKIESLDPGDPQSYLRTARSQRQMGDFETAAETIVKAIKENPDEEDAWRLLGDVLLDVSDPIRTLNRLERETSGMHNVPDLLTNKGAVLLRLGMYANALSCFDKALSIDDGHSRARRLRERCMEKTEKII